MADSTFIRIELDASFNFTTSTPSVEFALDANSYVPASLISSSGRSAVATVGFGGAISAGTHTFKVKLDPYEINGFFIDDDEIGIASCLTNSSTALRDISDCSLDLIYQSVGIGVGQIIGTKSVNIN